MRPIPTLASKICSVSRKGLGKSEATVSETVSKMASEITTRQN